MSNFSRHEVVENLLYNRIVPILHHSDVKQTIDVITACYEGGLKVFEFTNRSDLAHEVFSEVSKQIRRKTPDVLIGAGSIVDPGTTSLYIQLGADFIVSPVMNPQMGDICNSRKITWIPGAGTLTEILEADKCGADIVKVFPANHLGGPEYIKSIKGPCPWLVLMATGSISTDRETITSWLKSGAHCLGLGSQLFTKDILERKNYQGLTAKVKTIMQLVQDLRN